MGKKKGNETKGQESGGKDNVGNNLYHMVRSLLGGNDHLKHSFQWKIN